MPTSSCPLSITVPFKSKNKIFYKKKLLTMTLEVRTSILFDFLKTFTTWQQNKNKNLV